jgi:hypothetical protein
MNRLICLITFACFFFSSCKLMDKKESTAAGDKQLNQLLDNYYEEGIKLFPLAATENGTTAITICSPLILLKAIRAI